MGVDTAFHPTTTGCDWDWSNPPGQESSSSWPCRSFAIKCKLSHLRFIALQSASWVLETRGAVVGRLWMAGAMMPSGGGGPGGWWRLPTSKDWGTRAAPLNSFRWGSELLSYTVKPGYEGIKKTIKSVSRNTSWLVLIYLSKDLITYISWKEENYNLLFFVSP